MRENPKPLIHEQIELFSNEDTTKASDPLEKMTDEELSDLYFEHVGVGFRHDLSREKLIAVLNNPRDNERARLREIDLAEDKEELERTYRR